MPVKKRNSATEAQPTKSRKVRQGDISEGSRNLADAAPNFLKEDAPKYAQSDDETEEAVQTVATGPKDHGNPHETLYIKNLNDKIKKEDLKRSLYMLFSTYGQVLDIIALKTAKMRGQAHISFADTTSAALALRNLQGFDIFGKSMNISFAKDKSNVIKRLEGTYYFKPV